MENTDARQIMERYKKLIDKALSGFLKKKLKEGISPETKVMLKLIADFNLRGGKRIRPVLVIYGYKCFAECKGKDEDRIIDASLAVELMESFLLMHDDIMDQDTLRRGGPTMHTAYSSIAKKRYPAADSQRFGESMAILAGDIAATFGNELLSESSFEPEKKVKVLKIFNSVIGKTCFGQIHDIVSEVKQSTKEKDVLRIQELKTAAYTFEGPLHIGAVLAGADDKELKMLSRFAIPIGQAFQIQDDILGMFGSEERTGKPVASDLREGKKTLLIIKALEKAKGNDKEMLLRCLGNKGISAEDINACQKIITDTGSLEYSRDLAKKLLTFGKKEIEKAKIRQEAKEFLIGIADYIAKRDI